MRKDVIGKLLMSKIIYLTSRPITYPGGDATRARSMIRLLSLKYSWVFVIQNRAIVDVISESNGIEHDWPANVELLSFRQNWLDVIFGLGHFIFGRLPLSVCLYYNRSIKKYILQNKSIQIHVHLAKSLINVPTKFYPTIDFDYCDVETKKIEKISSNSIRGVLFNIDLNRYQYLEKNFVFKRVFLINANEKVFLKLKNVMIIQNYRFEKRLSTFNSDLALDEILFIGNFKTISNKDALNDFLKDVWKDLRSDFVLKLAGLVPDNLANKLSKDVRINILGVYDKIDSIVSSRSIILVPNRIGGGIQNKLLDGLYTGVITVARKEVLEGLDLAEDSVIRYNNNGELLSILQGLRKEKESFLSDRRIKLLAEAERIESSKYDVLNWL